jgi:7-carboxy-7-deazaguanine synthase
MERKKFTPVEVKGPTKINLVKNGIFPIIYDGDGNKLPDIPDTGYEISGTSQGEGKLIGIPCLFVRTSGCNLRCSWIGSDGNGSPCDTPYSSHHPEANMMTVDDIIRILNQNTNHGAITHVVVSGGEPTLQDGPLAELLSFLRINGFHTTIETNGTIYTDAIASATNLISMSPKLKSSTPWEANLKNTDIKFNQKWAERHERERRNISAIQEYINSCYLWNVSYSYQENEFGGWSGGEGNDTYSSALRTKREVEEKNGTVTMTRTNIRNSEKDFQLKFVVSTIEDIAEIENDFLAHLEGVLPSDVCLMPEGVLPEDLMNKSGWVVMEAIKRGWRFTPRLHALLYGVKRGV